MIFFYFFLKSFSFITLIFHENVQMTSLAYDLTLQGHISQPILLKITIQMAEVTNLSLPPAGATGELRYLVVAIQSSLKWFENC